MNREPESRNNIPASSLFGANLHLSDEQLLLALDGELSLEDSGSVKSHLEVCWSCRVRRAHFEEAIAGVVEFRLSVVRSNPPISPGSLSMFTAELDQFAARLQRPSLRAKLAGLFRERSVFWLMPRHVWISGMIVAAIILLLSANVRKASKVSQAPKISVNDLLEYSQAAEVDALRAVAKPVVYQKLRIRTSNYDVTRTIYRDVNGRRQANRLAVNKNNDAEPPRDGGTASQRESRSNPRFVERELQQTFRDARLNWEAPLSPTSYSSWRDSLAQKQDEVMEARDGFTTLKTITAEGPVGVASIMIRTADFHPVAGNFRLPDMRYVEVDELEWEVLPIDVINPAVFAVEPTVPPVIDRPVIRVPAAPTDAELAESELQARIVLHTQGADLGEEIEFDRDTISLAHYGQRSVRLRGILSSPARKAELSTALRGIPNLELQLQTEEEADTQESQAARQESQGLGMPQSADFGLTFTAEESRGQDSREILKLMVGNGTTDKLPLDKQLQERFPTTEERTGFVNRVIDLAQDALAHAWALCRLRDRYSPEEVARLSSGSSRTLELLIHNHVLALSRSVDEARQMISPLIGFESIVPMAPHVNHDEPLPPTVVAEDWRGTVTVTFPEVQKMHRSVAALFGQPGQIIPDQRARVRELQSTFMTLKDHLPSLDEQASGSFLSGTKQEREVSDLSNSEKKVKFPNSATLEERSFEQGEILP